MTKDNMDLLKAQHSRRSRNFVKAFIYERYKDSAFIYQHDAEVEVSFLLKKTHLKRKKIRDIRIMYRYRGVRKKWTNTR